MSIQAQSNKKMGSNLSPSILFIYMFFLFFLTYKIVLKHVHVRVAHLDILLYMKMQFFTIVVWSSTMMVWPLDVYNGSSVAHLNISLYMMVQPPIMIVWSFTMIVWPLDVCNGSSIAHLNISLYMTMQPPIMIV